MKDNLLGENIKFLRKENEWGQEKLAERLGVAKSMVSKYESGANDVKSDKLKALSDLFGVTIDDLIKVDLRARARGSNSGNELQANFERRLAALEERLNNQPNPEDQATLDKLVKVLREKYPGVAKELGL